MQEETPLPVYFATETPQLLDIYADVKTSMNSDQAGSAAEGNDFCPALGSKPGSYISQKYSVLNGQMCFLACGQLLYHYCD